jgi:hypothetical protein
MPIILHLEKDNREVSFPFKFNSIWLDETEFVKFCQVQLGWTVGNNDLKYYGFIGTKAKVTQDHDD